MKKIYFLTGAAGTGKTSVFQELKKLLPPDTYCQESITRSFYKEAGIENEMVFMSLSLADKIAFQKKLFEYYVQYTRTVIAKVNATTMLIDRAPFDHLIWLIYSAPDLTLKEHKGLSIAIEGFFEEISQSAVSTLVEFPYPCPWTVSENKSSDGFRYDPHGKNMLISHAINREIDDFLFNNGHLAVKHIKCKLVGKNNNILTAKERAEFILA
jgi:hypothetical protein